MRIFSDQDSFRPSVDSKVPVLRGWVWIFLRALHLIGSLVFSRHPMESITWLRSMHARRRPLSMAIPWLTFGAIRQIKKELPAGANVFEFGSGHSTLYWLQSGATVVSVEDDSEWFRLLQAKLSQFHGSTSHLLLAQTKEAYLSAINTVSEKSQDLVLVDGAHRRDCVIAAIPYVRPGGLLVVDNTDWHWFTEHPLTGIPMSWVKTVHPGFGPMLGHRSETSVWRRPQSE